MTKSAAYGWGVSSRTWQTPFQEHTSTPSRKAAALPSKNGNHVPISSSLTSQSAILHTVAKVSHGVADCLDHDYGLTVIEDLFSRSPLDEREALSARLQNIGRGMAETEAMQGINLAVLSHVLAATFSNQPESAKRARAALDALHQLDLQSAIISPEMIPEQLGGIDDASSTDSAASHATCQHDLWLLVLELGRIEPGGVALLRSLCHYPHIEDASWKSSIDDFLLIYLRAAGAKFKQMQLQGKQLIAMPATIMQNASSALERESASLLDHALRDTLEKWRAGNASAGNNRNTWQMSAIRNGLYSVDDARFGKYEQVLAGFSEQVQQGLEKHSKLPVTDLRSFFRRMGNGLQRMSPFTRKTPIDAYQSIPRTPWQKCAPLGFGNATLHGGIQDGRVVRTMMAICIQTLRHECEHRHLAIQDHVADESWMSDNPRLSTASQECDIREAQLVNLIKLWLRQNSRLQLLEKTMKEVRILPRLKDADPLSPMALEEATAILLTELAYSSLKPLAQSYGLDIEQLARQEIGAQNTGISAQTMVDWMDDPTDVHTADIQGEMVKLSEKVNEHHFPDAAALDLANINAEELGRHFQEQIAGQELGSILHLQSGGEFGVSTGGLIKILSLVASCGLTGIKLNLGGKIEKLAGLSVGTATSGNFIDIYQRNISSWQLGLGISFGLGKISDKGNGQSFGVGAASGLKFTRQTVQQDGMNFRINDRPGGVLADADNNRVLGEMMKDLMAQGQDIQGKRLISLLEKYDPSIATTETIEKTSEFRISANAGTSYLHPNGSVFVGVDVAGKYNRSKSTSIEHGAALTVFRESDSSGSAVDLNALFASLTQSLTRLGSSDELIVGLNASFEALSGSAQIYHCGHTRLQNQIYKYGELKETSFYTITYKNAISFLRSVAERLHEFALQKAEKFSPHRMDDPQQASQAIEVETRKLEEFMSKSVFNAELTQSFQEYYEWSPKVVASVRQIDMMIASLSLEGLPDAGKRQRKLQINNCKKVRSQLLEDPALREFRFLVVFNNEGESKKSGLQSFPKYRKNHYQSRQNIVDFT